MLLLRSDLLTRHGIEHGFSTREGGVSTGPYASLNLGFKVGDEHAHVRNNHARLAAELAYALEGLFEVDQVHGSQVRNLEGTDNAEEIRSYKADALLSEVSGQALGVRTADCVPVLLAQLATGKVAAVHAGWRGAVAGVLLSALREMQATPGEIIAAIGPHIRAQAFEIGEEVAQVIESGPHSAGVVERDSGKPHADLARLLRNQLLFCGVCDEHIDDLGGCTYSEPERYFSHRRDQGVTGRHLAVIIAP